MWSHGHARPHHMRKRLHVARCSNIEEKPPAPLPALPPSSSGGGEAAGAAANVVWSTLCGDRHLAFHMAWGHLVSAATGFVVASALASADDS
jgi:hypothetical protein